MGYTVMSILRFFGFGSYKRQFAICPVCRKRGLKVDMIKQDRQHFCSKGCFDYNSFWMSWP